QLHVRDRVFPLTLMEANVLRYLIEHESKPVSRKAMLDEVGGLGDATDTTAIDNFIVRLRRYIEDDPTRPRHLQTVRGVGYRFVANPEVSGRKWPGRSDFALGGVLDPPLRHLGFASCRRESIVHFEEIPASFYSGAP